MDNNHFLTCDLEVPDDFGVLKMWSNNKMFVRLLTNNFYMVIKREAEPLEYDSDWIYENELLFFSYDEIIEFFVNELEKIVKMKQFSLITLAYMERRYSNIIYNLKQLKLCNDVQYSIVVDAIHKKLNGEKYVFLCLDYCNIKMNFLLPERQYAVWKLKNG